MSLAMRERLYRERRFVPIRMGPIREDANLYDWATYYQASMQHPCPCKDWRIDGLFFATIAVHALELKNGLSVHTPHKLLKGMMRSEALKHVDEFYKTGTIDGIAV